MDTNVIENLLQAFAALDEEITEGIQNPLLHARDTDWQDLLPRLQEDCEAIISALRKAQEKIGTLMEKAARTRNAAAEIYRLHKETKERVVPLTLSQSIAAIVGDYLRQGAETIFADTIQKQLAASGILPYVRNPAAVISSILARDARLERIDKGEFKIRIQGDSQEHTGQET